MKAKNTLTATAPKAASVPGKDFAVAISGDSMQRMIAKSMPDARSAARLTGALISIVSASEQLQNCSTMSIVAAALRGEGMGLVLGREYYVVPYGSTAVYVLGYKGLLALLISTGEVADTDCIEVREGEYIGRDRRTKRPSFDFSKYATDEEAEKHPVIGYYAYAEMKSGYFRGEYMSIGEILDHATRYSKSFDREMYNKMVNGELTPQELEKLQKKSTWYSSTETMMRKTVIRKLLNSGYIRLSNSAAINEALAVERNADEGLIPELSVDQNTGEVIEGTAVAVDDAPAEGEKQPATPSESETTVGPAESNQDDMDEPTEPDEDFTAGFFGNQ